MGKNKCIYIDTNVFIYYLNGDKEFGEYSYSLIQQLEKSSLFAATSVLTQMELLSLIPIEGEVKISEFLPTLAHLTIFPIDFSIATEAARIRREFHVKTPDALHLATAKVLKCSSFVTNDQKLFRFPELIVTPLSEFTT